jgi:hypothetical protein
MGALGWLISYKYLSSFHVKNCENENILFIPLDSATLANFATTGSAPFFSSEISSKSWESINRFVLKKLIYL